MRLAAVEAVLPHKAQSGWTALILAAVSGHTDCARLLLDAGADKDYTHEVCGRSNASAFWGFCRMEFMSNEAWNFLFVFYLFVR